MEKNEWVELYLDFQNVSKEQNVLKLVNETFGKIWMDSKIHYEIYFIDDEKEEEINIYDDLDENMKTVTKGNKIYFVGGGKHNRSTFPYESFEYMLNSILNSKKRIHEESKKYYEDLFESRKEPTEERVENTKDQMIGEPREEPIHEPFIQEPLQEPLQEPTQETAEEPTQEIPQETAEETLSKDRIKNKLKNNNIIRFKILLKIENSNFSILEQTKKIKRYI